MQGWGGLTRIFMSHAEGAENTELAQASLCLGSHADLWDLWKVSRGERGEHGVSTGFAVLGVSCESGGSFESLTQRVGSTYHGYHTECLY